MLADAPPQALPLAILGGTFDPVHWGHVRIASETAAALQLPEVRLMPSQVPVHRAAPGATGEQRLTMLKLAVAATPHLRWTATSPADWRERPSDWPPTRYEAKAIREGRPRYFLRFERI